MEVLFSKKNKSSVHPPIIFNGIEFTSVDEHKHLGLTLDPKLTFEKYIISKSKVARKNIGILKHLYPDQLYKLYIRSRQDYCDITFHVEMLEKIQYLAATHQKFCYIIRAGAPYFLRLCDFSGNLFRKMIK